MVKKEEVFFIGAVGVAGAAVLYYLIGKGKPPEMLTIDSAEFIPHGIMGSVDIDSAEFLPLEIENKGEVLINSAEFIPIEIQNQGTVTINSAGFIPIETTTGEIVINSASFNAL